MIDRQITKENNITEKKDTPVYKSMTYTPILSVEPDSEYLFPILLLLTLFTILFSFNFGFHRITSEIKIKFIFGFLMKFYMKLTNILHILNLLFRSASFGKLRLSS